MSEAGELFGEVDGHFDQVIDSALRTRLFRLLTIDDGAGFSWELALEVEVLGALGTVVANPPLPFPVAPRAREADHRVFFESARNKANRLRERLERLLIG